MYPRKNPSYGKDAGSIATIDLLLLGNNGMINTYLLLKNIRSVKQQLLLFLLPVRYINLWLAICIIATSTICEIYLRYLAFTCWS